MKKIISLALTLSMLACMATSAFAATEHVVGELGSTGEYADGLLSSEAFNAKLPKTTIDIKVAAGEVSHRYAVDVEYTNVVLNLAGGNRTWDVNQLKYVYTDTGTATGTLNPTIVVKNYSDLPVFVKADVAKAKSNDGLEITKTGIQEGWNRIESAAPTGSALVGQVKTLEFGLNVALADGKTWTDVANVYADEIATSQDGSATVATCTITVSNSDA